MGGSELNDNPTAGAKSLERKELQLKTIVMQGEVLAEVRAEEYGRYCKLDHLRLTSIIFDGKGLV